MTTRRRTPVSKRSAARRHQHGYALLALIFALIVMAITMTAALPNAVTQAKRERELEMMFRGEQIAEAIARYYSPGNNRLGPAGLVVKTPPPPYGYLTELKKLRDGVTIGNDLVYFARASSMIDPLTNEEWEPVRIGDPRLRRFFRAWQQFTGRQLPPIYASYVGAANELDTTEKPESTDAPGPGANGEPADTGNDDQLDDEDDDSDDDDEYDDEEDEDDGDDGDDGEEDDSSDDSSRLMDSGTQPLVVHAAYQLSAPNQNTNRAGAEGRDTTNTNRGGFKDPKFVFGKGTSQRLGPIIGVVSKKKGKSVITRFGLTKYEDMIFIYFPQQQFGAAGQLQPNQTPQQPRTTGGNDANGDGIPDDVKPNPTPKPDADDPDN